MRSLRHPFAGFRGTSERVALDQRHRFEVVRQDARGEETSDAATSNHGVAQWAARHDEVSLT